MNKKIVLFIFMSLIQGINCQQNEKNKIKTYHHPKSLFSISWDSKEWKQSSIDKEIFKNPDAANNLPKFDVILVDKKNKDIRFSIITQLPFLYGDIRSKNIREGFRYSILTYPGAEELYSDTITINGIWAYRIDYKVSENRFGDNNSKIFCSILIIKQNHWFVLQASSPLTNKLQTNNDLWNLIYPIVKTFESD